ncbi:MAG: mercuric reductase [Gemmatimonadetes bacterium]|nr:mercuric reductase [Gemmatimonadota bacterium]
MTAQLLSGDLHDDALTAQVHPRDWRNPTPKDRYHLVVIGAGTGGLVTAAAAAGLGAKVALVERHLMGGDCLNVGCVPSKAVISAARAWHGAREAAARFGGPVVSGPGDFAAAMERMRRLRAGLSPIDGAARFRALGVDVFLGEGRFTGRDTVAVGDHVLRFRRAVIATGARAGVPPIPGLAEAGFLTNETVFTLTTLPRRLAVIGGGPIGCELAQAFRRFGAEVTLVDAAPRLLPRDDEDAAALLADQLVSEGIHLVTSARVLGVERVGDWRELSLEHPGGPLRLAVDQVLVAAGRRPNLEGLGLDQAGIAATPTGITVDDRLRTTNPAVYAVGDVCSRFQFTHSADFQARLVVQNALFFGRARASRLVTPWCSYTSPEVAQVGLTAAEATAQGVAHDVVRVGVEHLDRAVLEDETRGFAKFVLARGSDRILGATIVGADAGDLIGEVTLAMTSGLGLGAIGRTMHPYPTRGEILRKAADAWRRGKLTPTVRRLFSTWFRIFR